MAKVTKLNLEDANVRPTRRLHLRDIQDENPEPRGTTGAQMHAARLSMGEDIATVASRLRIRGDQIEAIEGGDFDGLPGRAYSIGFVRSYAEYLGLDEVEMVAAFKAEFDAAQSPGAELVFPDAEEESRMPRGAVLVIAALVVAGLYGVWSLTVSIDRMVDERSTSAPSVVPATRVAQPGAERPATSQAGAAQVGVGEQAANNTDQGISSSDTTAGGTSSDAGAGTEAATTAGGAVENSQDSGAVAEGTVQAADSGVETQPAGTAQAAAGDTSTGTGADEVAAVEPTAASAQAGDAEDQVSPLETGAERSWEGFVYGQQNHDSRIIIRANTRTWVRVEDNAGNVLLSRTLRAGESYRAPDRAGMVLATRNAGALQLFVDGKPVGSAGSSGQVLADLPLDPASLSGQ